MTSLRTTTPTQSAARESTAIAIRKILPNREICPVLTILKQLIKMGELSGAEVNNTNDEITFKKSVWAKQKFICKSCGANLVVNFGHTLICEYCSGALEIQNK